MVVIGITGTNGKTTTCNLIADILEEAGFKVGMMTTANFKINKREWLNKTKQTMQGRFRLQKFLARAARSNCQFMIIETSSEGIAQFRHFLIDYDIACFTNLSPEHIESHGSFENYKKAKGKLFENLSFSFRKVLGGKKIKKVSVVNLKDKHADYFLEFEADEKYGYRIDSRVKTKNLEQQSQIQGLKIIEASNIKASSDGTRFFIEDVEFNLKLLGVFNIENALAAICIGLSQGISLSLIKKALEKVKQIPGRLEFIDEGQDFSVVVDYAHEPLGLENVYKTLKPQIKGRLISLLGSQGGGRDKAKRPILGRLAAKYADIVIVTNEDPYDDDPMEIINQVAEGAKRAKELYKIFDREEAIKKAISLARSGDLVLLTGKGCEQYMICAHNKKIPWDDRKVARRVLVSQKSRIK